MTMIPGIRNRSSKPLPEATKIAPNKQVTERLRFEALGHLAKVKIFPLNSTTSGSKVVLRFSTHQEATQAGVELFAQGCNLNNIELKAYH